MLNALIRALILVSLLWAVPVAVSEAAPGERMLVDAREYPWSAIGRVNAAGRGFCTGFLVSARVMLTAAHCLYDFRQGRWLQPVDVTFVAGYQRDTYLGYSRASSYIIDEDYTPRSDPDLTLSLKDWAVITLAEPLGETVGWLGLQRFDRATAVALRSGQMLALQAGYRRDRAHALSLGLDCRIRSLFGKGRGLLNSCDVVEGASGSPLLVLVEGELRVLGIHSLRASTVEGEDLAGAISTSIFDPKRGLAPAIKAGRQAGLTWGTGRGPRPNGEALSVPRDTVDQLLTRLGFLEPKGSGQPTSTTRQAAIEAFEQKAGLAVTGTPSLSLLVRLMEAIH